MRQAAQLTHQLDMASVQTFRSRLYIHWACIMQASENILLQEDTMYCTVHDTVVYIVVRHP
jgi:hypothetical protein